LAFFLHFPGHLLGPLIVWLAKRDDSSEIDAHGKEALREWLDNGGGGGRERRTEDSRLRTRLRRAKEDRERLDIAGDDERQESDG
jgi:hypothetical protein